MSVLMTLVALVTLVACGGGDSDDERIAAPSGTRPSSSSSTSTLFPSTTAPTTTAAAGAGAAASVSGREGDPSAPVDAGPEQASAASGPAAVMPAPGTYHYDTRGATTFALSTAPLASVTTLTVDPPAGNRQHWTRDLRDPTGNATTTDAVLEYGADGVRLVELRVTTSFAGYTDRRTLRADPPALLLARDARPGDHRELALQTDGGVATMVVDVAGREAMAVGGETVDTLVVRAVTTLPPGGDVTGRSELTVWVAPSLGLWVRERAVNDATAGGLLRYHGEYEAVLQRLAPA